MQAVLWKPPLHLATAGFCEKCSSQDVVALVHDLSTLPAYPPLRDLSGGLRGLQTASENIRRVFVWSSAKNHTKKPCMWAPRLRSRK